MKLAVVLLAIATAVLADELSSCRCPEGYEPKLDKGEPKCYGIFLKAIQPCNLVQRPKCVCGEDVTGINTDETGTWCAKFERGKLIKRWDCLNKEDWDKFKREHPDPTL